MSCCPCIVDCYAMFLDQFSANAFVDVVLHGSPLWPAMQNADVVMERCQTTANSLKLAILKSERRRHSILIHFDLLIYEKQNFFENLV